MNGKAGPQYVGHYWAWIFTRAQRKRAEALHDARPRSAGHRKISMTNATKRPHMQILRSLAELAEKDVVRRRYEYVVWRFIVRGNSPSKGLWEKVWCAVLKEVVETLSGSKITPLEALKFLDWDGGQTPVSAVATATGAENVFKDSKNG